MGNGTELGRVRGLGSAHAGTHHWWLQRLTAGGNLLLLTWLVISLLRLPLDDYQGVVGWLRSPWTAVPLALAIANVFSHMRLGLRVVVEDYQHDARKLIALTLINIYTYGAAALGIFCVLRVAFGAVPNA